VKVRVSQSWRTLISNVFSCFDTINECVTDRQSDGQIDQANCRAVDSGICV